MARNAQNRIEQAMKLGDGVPSEEDISDIQCLTARDVADAARTGDQIALDVVNETGKYLGRGLAMLIDILNPEMIVIGSIFTRQSDLLWPVAETVLKAEALAAGASVCQVVPAALGDEIGDYASIAVALED